VDSNLVKEMKQVAEAVVGKYIIVFAIAIALYTVARLIMEVS